MRPVLSDDGKYNLSVGVQDSQLEQRRRTVAGRGARYQTFRRRTASRMRDGQTMQYTVATDTITGQVVKLDVTMNVVK